MKHSPLPWRVCGGMPPHYKAIVSADDKYIIFCMADSSVDKEHGKAIPAPSMQEQEANARYIVEACNFFEKLKELIQ